jgi:parallel beta-helix repeat protein
MGGGGFVIFPITLNPPPTHDSPNCSSTTRPASRGASTSSLKCSTLRRKSRSPSSAKPARPAATRTWRSATTSSAATASQGHGWFYGAGILIAHSPNVEVTGNIVRDNTVVSNGFGIALFSGTKNAVIARSMMKLLLPGGLEASKIGAPAPRSTSRSHSSLPSRSARRGAVLQLSNWREPAEP